MFADNTSVANTADGCQYTCNDGYRVSTGTCGGTGTTGFSCNGAPTLTISAPTGTITGVAATLKLNATRTGVAVDTG